MENQNVHNTLNSVDERVTSTYAELYFADSSSGTQTSTTNILVSKKQSKCVKDKDEWISPSDLLISTLKLTPPFTSRITRGKTHEGILVIGNLVLEDERSAFLKSLTNLLHENDDSWKYILTHEKEQVIKKVKAIFENIFNYKSKIMKEEISKYYEQSLQDLEQYIKNEMGALLETNYSDIICDLNSQIHLKMQNERKKLEKILNKKYVTELVKVKKYYNLLLKNEQYRSNQLLNKSVTDRNEALKLFYKQIEARRITSTMYVMSLERKKCKVRKMLLENLQAAEIIEKLRKIKESNEKIEKLKEKHVGTNRINKQWEDNIKKILEIFLKFISFSLKLLPEQSSFLLDLQEMVVLQLQEMKKNSGIFTKVLIKEESDTNFFQFEQLPQVPQICTKEPFSLIGDLSDPVPPIYGSRETLTSEVDLTHFRVQRKYVYAKCHGFETIKQLLESQECRCGKIKPSEKSSEISIKSMVKEIPEPDVPVTSESSFESLLLDNVPRLEDCPLRKCINWIGRENFPNLASYIDFTEENLKRVTTILGDTSKKDITLPDLISAKDIAYSELPFSATKEKTHNMGTQYSSQEDLNEKQILCPCIDNLPEQQLKSPDIFKSTQVHFNEIEKQRKKSLDRLIREKPSVLKIFTDECFDYKL